jgi:hypothetical protein
MFLGSIGPRGSKRDRHDHERGVADGVFSAGAGTRGIFAYGASGYRTVSVSGAYFAANEFDGGLSGLQRGARRKAYAETVDQAIPKACLQAGAWSRGSDS